MKQLCCINNTPLASAVLTEDEDVGIRVDKVLEIRRQLGEGVYSIADRLDVVVDRIIGELQEV